MEEKQERLRLYQPFRDAYCEHVLKKLSSRDKVELMTKVYEPYYFDNYKLSELNNDKTLLEYLDSNCNGQALYYEEIDSLSGPELILSCALGTIDVDLMDGLERDWYNFAIDFLKNQLSQEIIDDLAYEYAIQYERDGFTDEARKKFMTMWPNFLKNAEDKDEYWNMQDILIELENDYQLSGIGDAMKLIKQEISWIWNSQYVARSEKLLIERAAKYDEAYRKQLAYLPAAVKKIKHKHQLGKNGQLHTALFNFSVLNSLTKNLNEYEMDKNDRLLQALKAKYNFNDIYDLKHDFLQYLLENYRSYVNISAIIPPEPHKYRVYLCTLHNKGRRSSFYQSAIEYYFYHQEEIDRCNNCEVESQLHYYSAYYVEVQLNKQNYSFSVSYPMGKTWLPELTQLPKIDIKRQKDSLEKKATEEELLWAYNNDLLAEIAEFMNK